MSILVSSSEQICHSPTNHSKAKMLFSFTRSPRFPKKKENECHEFYNLSSNLRKRSTGFGYGKKYDFTKEYDIDNERLPDTPAPGVYEKQTVFDESKKRGKGFGFGSGRGEMEVTSSTPKNTNPGPGTYESTSCRDNIAYSLRTKMKFIDKEKLGIPGPGKYQSYTTFFKRNFLSKHINKEGRKFQDTEKLQTRDMKVPGPGSYDNSKTDFSPDGKYYASRYETSKSRTFGRQLRKTFVNRCQTPGPGNYKIPSQFGHYVSKGHKDDSSM